jgi:predicted ATPase with chaperone activity
LQRENSGFKFPTKKVIVNLGPANLRKEGAAFDLPIALATSPYRAWYLWRTCRPQS